ncbi:MAG: DUF2155 domain-containing protein [Hyphomicrobiaceae bacterium]|nr:DUF2155 domain-containing protein [Hyphomicrobiaceae bacterium]
MERAHHRQRPASRRLARLVLAPALLSAAAAPALAERLDNEVAVFAALDKVTARINRLEVRLNETVRFGSLKVTPRACYSRPPTEPPKTTSFVEVEEVQLDGDEKRIFTGWMFAESPGLNAVEHPVFDVWLTDCSQPQKTASQGRSRAGSPPAEAGQSEAPEPTRRRVRR